VKDGFAVALFVLLFASFVFFNPDGLSHPANYTPANPLVTPNPIVPEWYFLPFYAILRAVPNKLGGVLMMFAAIGVLFVLPWIDTAKVRSMRYRPMIRLFFFVFIFGCLVLGFCGANEPDAHPFPGGSVGTFVDADLNSFVWLSRLGALLYFQFFPALLLVGLIETPLPTPESISSPVLPQGATASPEKKG